MVDTANVKDIVAIVAGVLGLAAVAAVIYGVWCRTVAASEVDSNADGKITESEFNAYMESEASIPILAPMAQALMKVLSLVWKFEPEEDEQEEQPEA